MKRALELVPILILSTACIFFTGFQAVAICSWIQPFFLLHFFHKSEIWSSRRVTALSILSALFLHAIASSFAQLGFFQGEIHSDLLSATIAPIVFSLALWILLLCPFLASAAYRKRFNRARTSQPLVFTSLWTTAWILWNRFGGAGAFLDPATTQVAILPLVMSAGVWGIEGITFLMAWFSAILHDRAVLLGDNLKSEDRKRAMQIHRSHAKIFAAIFLLAFLYGGARISLLSGDFFQKDFSLTIERTVPVSCILGKYEVYEDVDVMLNRTRQRAGAGDRLVLWSEAAVKIYRKEIMDSLRSQAGEIAGRHKTHIGIAYEYKDPATGAWGNHLDLVLPDGSIGFSYVKAHPVPFVESYMTPGDPNIPAVDTELGRIGGAVCFDFEFPDLIRQAGQKRIDIMLQPAETWGQTGSRVLKDDSFRVAENGFTWFRCSTGGVSAIIDQNLQTIDYRKAMSDEIFPMELPIVRRAWTFYPSYGFVFAWLLVALALLHLTMLCLPLRVVRAILERSPEAFTMYITGERSFKEIERTPLLAG